MSSQDAGLSRGGLIEKVEQAWLELGYEGTDINGALTEEGTALYAAAAADAVLRAVADDLDAMYCDAGVSVREENNGDMYGEDLAYLDGVEAAARRVRALLGKDELQ